MFGRERRKEIEPEVRVEPPLIHAWQDYPVWALPDEQDRPGEQETEPVLYDYPEYYLG